MHGDAGRVRYDAKRLGVVVAEKGGRDDVGVGGEERKELPLGGGVKARAPSLLLVVACSNEGTRAWTCRGGGGRR